MKKLTFLLITAIFSLLTQAQDSKTKFVLMIHGGCGNFSEKDIPDSIQIQYKTVMEKSLQIGYDILAKGGSSVEAVEACVKVLEDSPLFNAGKGAVFTDEGKNELDASIMDGKTMNAGAVASVRTIKNPIAAARKVMYNSPHVMLVGEGAEEFAKTQNIAIVDTSYFFTQKKWNYYKSSKKKREEFFQKKKNGTVGAVALDKNGNLAAATSTGGMSNKKYGRIGDSPIIGAGTYANNNTCAVSGTGWGEFFIRNVIAYDISALYEYKGLTIENASEYLMNEKLKKHNANGGVIVIDKDGNFHAAFNTEGMFRGHVSSDGKKHVSFFKEK